MSSRHCRSIGLELNTVLSHSGQKGISLVNAACCTPSGKELIVFCLQEAPLEARNEICRTVCSSYPNLVFPRLMPFSPDKTVAGQYPPPSIEPLGPKDSSTPTVSFSDSGNCVSGTQDKRSNITGDEKILAARKCVRDESLVAVMFMDSFFGSD